MKSERNPYLIGKAMKYYLIASILSTIVVQLNVIVDGIIVGHCVSPDALSAVNLYSPISLALVSIGSLLGAGATVLAARAIGGRDMQKASQFLSTALSSLIVVGFVVAVVFLLFHDSIVELVSKEERLNTYFVDYMLIMGCFGVTGMLSSFLGLSVEVDGNPRLVTLAQSIAAITNIILDVVLVGFADCGIQGAAWASVISTIVAIVIMYRHFLDSQCLVHMKIFRNCTFKAFSANLQQGQPLIAGNAILMLLIFFLNTIVMDMQGADGMFVLSVCISLLTIGMLFANGIGSMVLSVGGFLNGQKDFSGLRMLVNRGIGILLGFTLVIMVVVEIAPGFFVSIYGAENADLIAYAAASLRVFIIALPSFLMVLLMANEFQMLGYLVLVPAVVALLPLLLFPCMYIFTSLWGASCVWYAFPCAGVLVIAVILIATEIIRSRKRNVTHFTLIPQDSSECFFNVSIENNTVSMGRHLNALIEKMSEKGIAADLIFNISLCAEETILNIIQHAYKDKAEYYIDIMAVIHEGKLTLSVKDNGRPYNPLSQSKDMRGIGLTLVSHACQEIDYKYMYGQNMAYFTWMI